MPIANPNSPVTPVAAPRRGGTPPPPQPPTEIYTVPTFEQQTPEEREQAREHYEYTGEPGGVTNEVKALRDERRSTDVEDVPYKIGFGKFTLGKLLGKDEEDADEVRYENVFVETPLNQRDIAFKIAELEQANRDTDGNYEEELDELRADAVSLGIPNETIEYARILKRRERKLEIGTNAPISGPADRLDIFNRGTSAFTIRGDQGQEALNRALEPDDEGRVVVTDEEFEDIQTGQRKEDLQDALHLLSATSAPAAAKTLVRPSNVSNLQFARHAAVDTAEEAGAYGLEQAVDPRPVTASDIINLGIQGGAETGATTFRGTVGGGGSSNVFDAAGAQEGSASPEAAPTPEPAPAPANAKADKLEAIAADPNANPFEAENAARAAEEIRSQNLPARRETAVAQQSAPDAISIAQTSGTSQGATSSNAAAQSTAGDEGAAQASEGEGASSTQGATSTSTDSTTTTTHGRGALEIPGDVDVPTPLLPPDLSRRQGGRGGRLIPGQEPNTAIYEGTVRKTVDLSVPEGEPNAVSEIIDFKPLKLERRGNKEPIPGIRASQHSELITDKQGRTTQRKVARRKTAQSRTGARNVNRSPDRQPYGMPRR